MKPSIGRIVHYTSYGTPGGEYLSVCRAAMVTQVHHPFSDTFTITNGDGKQVMIPVADKEPADQEPCVGLCVMNPTGLFFHEQVPFSGGLTGGTWHWPESVED